jgi:hypothetical protein
MESGCVYRCMPAQSHLWQQVVLAGSPYCMRSNHSRCDGAPGHMPLGMIYHCKSTASDNMQDWCAARGLLAAHFGWLHNTAIQPAVSVILADTLNHAQNNHLHQDGALVGVSSGPIYHCGNVPMGVQ